MNILPSGNGICNEKTNRTILIVGIAVFCYFVIMRDILHIAYSKFVLVALAGSVALFLNYSNLVSFVSFLIPLSCGIPGNYIFIILTVLFVMKRPMLSKYHLIFASIFISQEFILNFISQSSDLVEFIAYCIKLFLTLGIIFDNNDRNCKQHLIAFVLGATFLLIMILSITAQFIEFEDIINGQIRLGETKTTEMNAIQFGTNANTVGFYSLLAVSISIVLMRLTKDFKWLYIFIILVNIFIGLLSVSRSYLLFLAIILVMFFIMSFKLNAKSIFAVIVTALLLVFFIGYIAEHTTIFESYQMRFEDSTLESAGGRTNIMEKYFEWQFTNPFYSLFGAGATTHSMLFGYDSPHNGLQQLLVSYGVIGFLMMFYCFFMAFKLMGLPKKSSPIIYIPFIAEFLFVQTVQLLYPTEYFMSFICGFMCMKLFVFDFSKESV